MGIGTTVDKGVMAVTRRHNWSKDQSFLEWLVRLVGLRTGLAVRGTELVALVEEEQRLLSRDDQKVALETIGRAALERYGLDGAKRALFSPIIVDIENQVSSLQLALEATAFVIEDVARPSDGRRLIEEGENARRISLPITFLQFSDEDRARLIEQALRARGTVFADAVEVVLGEVKFRADRNVIMLDSVSKYSSTVPLRDLFDSTSINAECGRFFDQRFVDYLVANYEEIGLVNWRKFEALTAEYFHRLGMEVRLGPGGNDDGVDLRVWESGVDVHSPPTFIVQCKREKRKIGKVVVKGLAADVNWEGAHHGLLVATAEWLPGARRVVESRQYPVREVNSENIREWLVGMRSTGTGIWS